MYRGVSIIFFGCAGVLFSRCITTGARGCGVNITVCVTVCGWFLFLPGYGWGGVTPLGTGIHLGLFFVGQTRGDRGISYGVWRLGYCNLVGAWRACSVKLGRSGGGGLGGLLFIVLFKGTGLGPAGLSPLSLLGLVALWSPSIFFPHPLGLFPGPLCIWGDWRVASFLLGLPPSITLPLT